jgi:hypothetical protein
LDQGRYEFTLPEAARKLEIAPSRGDKAVVFATGEILEVWHVREWLEHVRAISGRLDELGERAIEAMEDRGQGE